MMPLRNTPDTVHKVLNGIIPSKRGEFFTTLSTFSKNRTNVRDRFPSFRGDEEAQSRWGSSGVSGKACKISEIEAFLEYQYYYDRQGYYQGIKGLSLHEEYHRNEYI